MEIHYITCVGSGTIGCGWAVNYLLSGYPVVMYDVDQECLKKAEIRLRQMLQNCEIVGIIAEEQAKKLLAQVKLTCDLGQALKDAELIQESVPENLALKQQVLENIEKYCRADALIATSTSGLSVTQIARNAVHPERVLGAHPFNPVYLIPLVEIVKGDRSSEQAVQCLVEFLRSIRKEPVVLQKEIPGFIANRLQAAMHREARDLVYRGVCSVEDVDKAVVYGPGSRWGIIGPHIIFELNGGGGGIRKQARQKGDTTKAWYHDMATWDEIPEGYIDKAYEGLMEELSHRTKVEGQTHEELELFRDKGLAAMLRFHGKL